VRLYDSHSHLDAPGFDADREAVLDRAEAAGVLQQLVPAVGFASWPATKSTCALRPGLKAAYGLHPMFLAEHRPEQLDALPDWIEREKPPAVGECGLDFFVEGLDPEMQRFYFIRQLEIARDFDLPVVLHARRTVATMPIEHLLIETDSPDQPDAARRGQRNEPAFLVDVLREVAKLRGIDEAEVAAATVRNAEALFGA